MYHVSAQGVDERAINVHELLLLLLLLFLLLLLLKAKYKNIKTVRSGVAYFVP